jgi:hypothetical protein
MFSRKAKPGPVQKCREGSYPPDWKKFLVPGMNSCGDATFSLTGGLAAAALPHALPTTLSLPVFDPQLYASCAQLTATYRRLDNLLGPHAVYGQAMDHHQRLTAGRECHRAKAPQRAGHRFRRPCLMAMPRSGTIRPGLLTVRSYLDSARKHGLSAFDAIHRAFTGNLWMPPVALAD